MNRLARLGLLALGFLPLSGCQEELPTAARDDLIPVEAVSFEIVLPFEDFGSNLQVLGGFGSAAELPYAVLAHQYEGDLEARALIGLRPYPTAATVTDSTGASRPDSSLVFVGGRLVAKFDTVASVLDGPVELAVGAIENPWHFGTASWQVAIDTISDYQEWPEEGAGPVTPLVAGTWDPAESDSVVFELDSAAVALWSDTASAGQGFRMDVLTEGVRLENSIVRLFLITRPSSNPDTLVDLLVQQRFRTFVYEPVLEAPASGIRVGGVPAWRTVFDLDFPDALDGPQELCDAVGCPLTLQAAMINSAYLSLKTGVTPAAFRPSDSLRIDIREILAPERLPKSPLGSSLSGTFGVSFAPEFFGDLAGTRVEIPLGAYVADLIASKSQPELEVPGTLVLLSTQEPSSLPYGSFFGAEGADAPEIRLIITVGQGVEIR